MESGKSLLVNKLQSDWKMIHRNSSYSLEQVERTWSNRIRNTLQDEEVKWIVKMDCFLPSCLDKKTELLTGHSRLGNFSTNWKNDVVQYILVS